MDKYRQQQHQEEKNHDKCCRIHPGTIGWILLRVNAGDLIKEFSNFFMIANLQVVQKEERESWGF